MRKIRMGDLVLRCQRRADMEGNPKIKPPEWKSLISEMYGHLYAVVAKAGLRYFEGTATISATGAASYALPADHDLTIGIDRVVDSSGRTCQLGELMVQERNEYSGMTGDAIYYSVVGQNVVFFPTPQSGDYKLTYVPQSPDISAISDSTEVDVVTADGEAFLIWGVACKALPKTESNVTVAMTEREAAAARFAEDVGLRAQYNPRRRVVMSTPLEDDWWY